MSSDRKILLVCSDADEQQMRQLWDDLIAGVQRTPLDEWTLHENRAGGRNISVRLEDGRYLSVSLSDTQTTGRRTRIVGIKLADTNEDSFSNGFLSLLHADLRLAEDLPVIPATISQLDRLVFIGRTEIDALSLFNETFGQPTAYGRLIPALIDRLLAASCNAFDLKDGSETLLKIFQDQRGWNARIIMSLSVDPEDFHPIIHEDDPHMPVLREIRFDAGDRGSLDVRYISRTVPMSRYDPLAAMRATAALAALCERYDPPFQENAHV